MKHIAQYSRDDILFLRGCKPSRNVIEGSKPQLRAAVFAARGLLKLVYVDRPRPSMSFDDLRRPMIYTLTEQGREAAKVRLPMKKR